MRNPEKRQLVHDQTRRQNEDTMRSRRGLTTIVGAQFLALSFEVLTPLLSHVLSSASQDELSLLDNHHVLKTGHLGRQSLDLGPSLHILVG